MKTDAPFLSLTQAAQRFGFSRNTLYSLVQRGLLPGYRLGQGNDVGKIWLKASEVAAAIQRINRPPLSAEDLKALAQHCVAEARRKLSGTTIH